MLETASMAGEKLPLLFIGKVAKPRCFKNVKKTSTSVPVELEGLDDVDQYSKPGLGNSDIKIRNSYRKIALVVDNYTANPVLYGLTNVRLVFFPPNTTAKTL